MSFIFQIKQIEHSRHVAFYEKEEHRMRVFFIKYITLSPLQLIHSKCRQVSQMKLIVLRKYFRAAKFHNLI